MTLLLSIRTWLATAAGAAVMFFVMNGYQSLIVHPRITKEARQDYVHRAEKNALAAALEEERRLRENAEKVTSNYARNLAAFEERQIEKIARLEQEIADYEDHLELDDRSCRLGHVDAEWLRGN